MYRITALIEGTAPLLFNRPRNEDIEGSNKGKLSMAQRLAEAREKVYRDDRGLYLPAWTVKRVLADGCQRAGLKEGRGSLVPYLLAEVFIDEARFVVAEESIHEQWGRRPARTGGAMIVRRPMVATGWQVRFSADVLEDRRDPNQIHMALEAAGLKVGIGSWRPEFGRFIVREFAVV